MATAPVSCLENPMGRGAWWAAVQGVPEPDAAQCTAMHDQGCTLGSGNHFQSQSPLSQAIITRNSQILSDHVRG